MTSAILSCVPSVSALQMNMKYADADKNAVIDANDTQTILSYIVGSKVTLGTVTDGFETSKQSVSISGFPGYVKNVYTINRYVGTGNVIDLSSNLIYTSSFASGGNSGGPIYIEYITKGQTFRSAIGICDFIGENNSRFSGGARITTPILRFYRDNDYIG